jgi:hypothetical protein
MLDPVLTNSTIAPVAPTGRYDEKSTNVQAPEATRDVISILAAPIELKVVVNII